PRRRCAVVVQHSPHLLSRERRSPTLAKSRQALGRGEGARLEHDLEQVLLSSVMLALLVELLLPGMAEDQLRNPGLLQALQQRVVGPRCEDLRELVRPRRLLR